MGIRNVRVRARLIGLGPLITPHGDSERLSGALFDRGSYLS